MVLTEGKAAKWTRCLRAAMRGHRARGSPWAQVELTPGQLRALHGDTLPLMSPSPCRTTETGETFDVFKVPRMERKSDVG